MRNEQDQTAESAPAYCALEIEKGEAVLAKKHQAALSLLTTPLQSTTPKKRSPRPHPFLPGKWRPWTTRQNRASTGRSILA
jgi:hypothetical protein